MDIPSTHPPEPGGTDRELWEHARNGNGAAFGLLFDRHSRAVYNHCFRLTASWSTAEDLTSAVFLQAWRRRNDVRLEGDSARGWLLAVGTNLARTERRSTRRRLNLAERLPRPGHEPDHADDVAARLDDERRMAEVLELIRTLPQGEQEAIGLCLWAGVGYAEAAVALGVAEGTLRSRVSRGRTRLAGRIAELRAMTTVPTTTQERTW